MTLSCSKQFPERFGAADDGGQRDRPEVAAIERCRFVSVHEEDLLVRARRQFRPRSINVLRRHGRRRGSPRIPDVSQHRSHLAIVELPCVGRHPRRGGFSCSRHASRATKHDADQSGWIVGPYHRRVCDRRKSSEAPRPSNAWHAEHWSRFIAPPAAITGSSERSGFRASRLPGNDFMQLVLRPRKLE